MQYFSTNRRSASVSFRDAAIIGQPDDKGLYFPADIPAVSDEFLASLPHLPDEEIAFTVMRPFVAGSLPDDVLAAICGETVSFDFPLVALDENISVLELFHGPTMAFKDVGARFMSRCLEYFARDISKRPVVIVATSGDTGGAVANGFANTDGLDVVILFPKGLVSRVQELQLTRCGKNVTSLEVEGNFDDCQRLAKTALADTDLGSKLFLTSANSINVARWLPQQIYYFLAVKQWKDAKPPVFSVPSGNFGNIAAAILAYRSGLPVRSFIAACNANDAFTRFILTGDFEAKPSVPTMSNAMDIGDPSNFVRILELFDGDAEKLRKMNASYSISDEETAEAIRSVHDKFGYTLDPHGAVAFAALTRHRELFPEDKGIFVETAHPVKFDSVEKILGMNIKGPASLLDLQRLPKRSIEIDTNYKNVKDILLGLAS
ncbi:MAG: threonine synthase [Acidobacteria bacterium]|nr:threonine synthase [Acidobacteriota bacterium]